MFFEAKSGGASLLPWNGRRWPLRSKGRMRVCGKFQPSRGAPHPTSGGGVTVKVPGNAVFDLDAKTFDGGVRCDLPVTVQGRIENGRLKGAVNGGGPAVVLRSGGGPIHIKKM